MDGILNINKSPDMTSFQVVASVKRITCEKHAGHAGTLDPMATGVLPICLGQATRIIEYLFNTTKTYCAEVMLGVTTDTYDATGKIVRREDASGITRHMVEAALCRFKGSIPQTPPMFSAIKYHGKPLYKLARSGIEIAIESRIVQIYSLEITDWQPPVFQLEIVCGKGTYIRSLAFDLGEALGCGAHMKNLVRQKVGPFNVEDALSLTQLQEVFESGKGSELLYPVDFPLTGYDAIIVTREQKCSLIHGAPISLVCLVKPQGISEVGDARLRAYTGEGEFVGMIKFEPASSSWRPEKVFLKNCCGLGN